MDGSEAIEDNRQALKRIVAILVDMAGLAAPAPASPSMGEVEAKRREGVDAGEDAQAGQDDPIANAPQPKPGRPTLPRILWRAIVSLLRPAESAARRLIIAASRGIVVPAPRLREPEAEPPAIDPMLRKFGLAVMLPPAGPARAAFLARLRKAGRTSADSGEGREPRTPTFPLFDPPRRIALYGVRHNTVPPHLAPRIMFPGFTEPHRLPPPPSADDLVSAKYIVRRLAALSAALDDLPGQAKRFARWRARRDAISAQEKKRDATDAWKKEQAEAAAIGGENNNRAPWRPRRFSPLRLGRPPGGRLFRYDPNVAHPPNIREVDQILAHAHSMALYALECPDTS